MKEIKSQVNPWFRCMYFASLNFGEISNTCPYKVDGRKQCIIKGKVCENLKMELLDSNVVIL